MAASPELQEQAAEVMRVAAARVRAGAALAGQQASVWAEVTMRHSVQMSEIMARHMQRSFKEGVHGGRRCLATTAQHARALGQRARVYGRDELLPVVRHYSKSAHLRAQQAFELRNLDDGTSIQAYLANLGDQLDFFADEVRRLPAPAVVALSFVALRMATALNALVSAGLSELLRGRTALARLGCASALAPGCFAAYTCGGALLKDVPLALSATESRGAAAARAGGELRYAKAAVVLARNARRMPLAFWLATSMSGALALHALGRMTATAVRRLLRLRLRTLVFTALALAVVKRIPGAHALVSNRSEAWGAIERALETSWYNLQACSREGRRRASLAMKQIKVAAASSAMTLAVQARKERSAAAAAAAAKEDEDEEIVDCSPRLPPVASPLSPPRFRGNSDL
eukprot:TRINITY_DN17175_c0_g1_i1.p1 TRINITY_DN17175_c0_g1~~TRINITY_DN17175_c0_g1_i1.p1  ORF type:complete len:403 (+),score=101.61 TRINITY_DN17175_c0_g1_i1:83-1291(+)